VYNKNNLLPPLTIEGHEFWLLLHSALAAAAAEKRERLKGGDLLVELCKNHLVFNWRDSVE
jgi:hypothetical protein